MFFGTIKNLRDDRKILPEALVKGLEYLQATDVTRLEPGRYEIEGETIFALVQDYETYPKAERRSEAHARFVDIQFIVAGVEMIGYGPTGSGIEVEEDLLEEKDVLFYKSVENEMDLVLASGSYAIFFPGEVHRPGCAFPKSRSVKKVVIKVCLES